MGRQQSSLHEYSTLELESPSSSSIRSEPGKCKLRTVPPRPLPYVARPSHEIWGQFNNYRSNGVAVSAALHVVFIALLIASAIFGRQVVQKVAPRQIVALIAPSPDSYALPTSPKVVSGGGGEEITTFSPRPKDIYLSQQCSRSRLQRWLCATRILVLPLNQLWLFLLRYTLLKIACRTLEPRPDRLCRSLRLQME